LLEHRDLVPQLRLGAEVANGGPCAGGLFAETAGQNLQAVVALAWANYPFP